MTKKWYTSKTLWVNLAALIAAVASRKIAELIQPCIELVILAIINIILRAVTKERIEV